MAQAISSLGLLLPRINAVPMRRRHYGHGKAQALRWQHFSPGSDQFLVSAAHSADVEVKIIQPQWIDVAVLLTKRDRKSAVQGKSGYVRVNRGGRRLIKKKTTNNKTSSEQ